jgi:hypothetical protein
MDRGEQRRDDRRIQRHRVRSELVTATTTIKDAAGNVRDVRSASTRVRCWCGKDHW